MVQRSIFSFPGNSWLQIGLKKLRWGEKGREWVREKGEERRNQTGTQERKNVVQKFSSRILDGTTGGVLAKIRQQNFTVLPYSAFSPFLSPSILLFLYFFRGKFSSRLLLPVGTWKVEGGFVPFWKQRPSKTVPKFVVILLFTLLCFWRREEEKAVQNSWSLKWPTCSVSHDHRHHESHVSSLSSSFSSRRLSPLVDSLSLSLLVDSLLSWSSISLSLLEWINLSHN